ncbi:MAG: UDP-N-acetylmuramate dehydrogenase [Candidatus Lambdaproteobacteria bacterium]|nr:UDP-N-acetylmuramate dehydrogenase [Candidatus Lambdaproteobacteria bacterium]
MSGGWQAALRQRLRDSRLRFDAPLRNATTLRIGGPAECLVELESEADLLALFTVVDAAHLPLFVLGKGSNVLVPDQGIRGVVIRLGRAFAAFEDDGARGGGGAGPGGGEAGSEGSLVRAGAAMANAAFIEACREHGLGGMEFLIAVPGTIGGAIAMNAGAHQGSTADHLRRVRFFERGRGIAEEPADRFEFAYRHSTLRGQLGRVTLAGAFALAPTPPAEIAARLAHFQAYRRETQPRDFPNCGSVFKNPPGHFAARLIQEAGLKGQRFGDAQVSEKHANFIVNRGAATARDVLALVDLVRRKVYSVSGIELELEVQVL